MHEDGYWIRIGLGIGIVYVNQSTRLQNSYDKRPKDVNVDESVVTARFIVVSLV